MSTAVAPRQSRSQTKLVFFLIFVALTLFVTYMKNAQVLNPGSDIARHFAPVKWYLVMHAFFGGLALLMGLFQFSNRLRARYLPVHRVMGYVYVASVFIGAPLAIPIAKRIDSTELAVASAVQAFGWMACTGIALYCIRRGNIVQHRRWMIRGYAFAMVFTVTRLIIPIPPIMKMGLEGISMVVWSAIVLAAFLPSIALDWKAIVAKPASRAASAD